jgi:hypothetical protein
MPKVIDGINVQVGDVEPTVPAAPPNGHLWIDTTIPGLPEPEDYAAHAQVAAAPPDATAPVIAPPDGFLWVDTAADAAAPEASVAYAQVATTPPDADAPVVAPPDGFLWVDTATPDATVVGVPAGGLPGEVLAKATGADYDVQWKRQVQTIGMRAWGLPAGWTFPATPSTNVPFPYNTVEFDLSGSYDPATGMFTCPREGLYLVNADVQTNRNEPRTVGCSLQHNGVSVASCAVTNNYGPSNVTSGYCTPMFSTVVRCAQGDQLQVFSNSSIASDASVRGNQETQLSIAYIGPTV